MERLTSAHGDREASRADPGQAGTPARAASGPGARRRRPLPAPVGTYRPGPRRRLWPPPGSWRRRPGGSPSAPGAAPRPCRCRASPRRRRTLGASWAGSRARRGEPPHRRAGVTARLPPPRRQPDTSRSAGRDVSAPPRARPTRGRGARWGS